MAKKKRKKDPIVEPRRQGMRWRGISFTVQEHWKDRASILVDSRTSLGCMISFEGDRLVITPEVRHPRGVSCFPPIDLFANIDWRGLIKRETDNLLREAGDSEPPKPSEVD